MKFIVFIIFAMASFVANSYTFPTREPGGGFDSREDFLFVGNDQRFDTFEKVEIYCENKYPGFLIKSQKADWCIEGILLDSTDAKKRIKTYLIPDKRRKLFDYPNSENEFYKKIKDSYGITNAKLIFSNVELQEVSKYFQEIEQSIAYERANMQASMELRESQEKEREIQKNEEAKQKAAKDQLQAKVIADRKAELSDKRIAPSNFDEATVFYASTDAYDLATSPKIAADKKTYHSVGYIELTPDEMTFIARIKSGAEGIISPYGRQLMRELGQLSGRTKEPYFSVRVPPSLQKVYLENARINKPMRVIGVYSGNTEIKMTTNQTVKIPVLDAVFFDFGGDVMYGLGFPKISRP